ncbi:MAG: right-handed parallel beta-helix repeat-containing protein [Thermoplasmata archaeon]|nr:right-handed parallel beta-helix repeat-containing protein [Thermoplasmata archaeon]
MFSSIVLVTEQEDVVEAKGVVEDETSYIISTPFRINSNADFLTSPKVSGGGGTEFDPWIIEGWDINGTGYGYCLYIGNTTDHFEVRGCYLHDASGNLADYFWNSGITLFNVQNGSVTNNVANSNYRGIRIDLSDNNNITNNTASSNDNYGIEISTSDNNNIINNNANSNTFYGIEISTSNNNNITNNNILDNRVGILQFICWNTNITNNTMVGDGIIIFGPSLTEWNTHSIDSSNTVNGKPVYFWKNQTGGTVPTGAGQVILANCTNVVIEKQNISNCTIAIELGFSSNNVITNNTVSDNFDGIYLYDSINNTLYHNNLIGNNNQAFDDGANFWDNGYPGGGNHWSDYAGIDNNNGINQDILGFDGIGDTPYTNIGGGAGAQDNYPLMEPIVNGLVECPPFRINSNADFDQAHGVANWDTGDGSVGNPWIIENWDINGTGYGYCIYIGNTTEYFQVEDCNLHHSDGVGITPYFPNSGIAAFIIQNGTIANNTFSNNQMNGIYIRDSINASINSNEITSTQMGINLDNSNNILVLENNFSSVSNIDVYVKGGLNNSIVDNTIFGQTKGDRGIFLSNTAATVTGNFINESEGIEISSSLECLLSNNQMFKGGVKLSAGTIQQGNIHTIDTTNTVNGKPVQYWKDTIGGTIPPGAGQVILINCSDVLVTGQILDDTIMGIQMCFSSNNTISDNQVCGNKYSAIYLLKSNDNVLRNNNASTSWSHGFHIRYSENNTFSENTASWNSDGIVNGLGFYLFSCKNNNITNNNCSHNKNIGIYLTGSNYNNVYHNTFDNTDQAYDNTDTNTWDFGYPGGGNYWSDYSGVDNNCTATQNIPPSDGIGDTPYLVDQFSDTIEVVGEVVWVGATVGFTFNVGYTNILNYDLWVFDGTWWKLDPFLSSFNLATGDGVINGFDLWAGCTVYAGLNYTQSVDIVDQYPLMEPLVNGLVECPPFRINSNTDFDAAHGVANWDTGDGSAGNPWVIENWEINGTGYGYCIYIGNTTEYFEVRNCSLYEASGFHIIPYYPDAGLVLYNSHNGFIDNNVLDSNYHGMFIRESDNNVINNNIATSNSEDGIYFYDSNGNMITNNTVSDSTHGIRIASSITNTLRNNTMLENGIYIDGGLQHWNTHIIDTSNTVNGKVVQYWKDQTGGTIPMGAGQVILANCNNVIVSNQNVSNGTAGIEVGFSSNNHIVDNTAFSNNLYGIYLRDSDNNNITNNTASLSNTGIQIYSDSTGNIVSENNATLNTWGGIVISGSSDNSILTNNTADSNGFHGIYLSWSDHCTVSNSATAFNGLNGIYLWFSTDNIIRNNNVSSNIYGIHLVSSSANTIYHNDIINNTDQAYDDGANNWDNSYPDGGNYWDDYAGVDNNNGINQDIPGQDSIGDTPYTNIGGGVGAQDDYPLMYPTYIDTMAPQSSIDAIIPYWLNTLSLSISATASDTESDIANVTLWYKYSSDNATWPPLWTHFELDETDPWSWIFNFPDGEGNYLFISIANDTSGNTEISDLPESSCGYDITAPSSNADNTPSTTNESAISITYTESDALSGVKNVSLWYSYSPDGISYGTWKKFDTESLAPAFSAFVFDFPEDAGYYQFHTRGTDKAGNWEDAPAGNDTWVYEEADTTPPDSSLNAISTYWKNTSPITISAIASDADSGIANVTLWYRHSPNNSTWGANKSFGIDTVAPWNWTFNFPDGEGYYEFYSIANDSVNNTELPPSSTDTACTYDVTQPEITDNSPAAGTTGDSYTFRAVVTDNMALSDVHVIYWFGSGTETNATMTHTTADNYVLEISIPLNSLDTLHYRIVAVDEAGNWASTAIEDVTINDNDDPVADAGPYQTVAEGTIVIFDGSSSTDNIGIVNYTWTFNDGVQNITLYEVAPTHNFTIAGNYTVTLTVKDDASNSDAGTMMVSVNPTSIVDTDGDGVPDDQDEFPDDPDETTDTDGDGIGDNADTDDDDDGFLDEWEETLGTDPADSDDTPTDTDGDGIPDGDTENTKSWMDTDDDGDGVPDADDPDPLDPDITDNGGGNNTWLYLMIILVIAGIAGAVLVMKSKGKKPEPEEPEVEETPDIVKEDMGNQDTGDTIDKIE